MGRDCGIVNDVGGRTEFRSNGVCSELRLRNIPEMVAEDCVPLHPPLLQGSDISALLKIVFEKGWYRSPQIGCVEGLQSVSDEILRQALVCEHHPLVPRNYV